MYTHCYAHSLNLAVGNVIKRSKVCTDALDVTFEIIRTFCPTRWTVRDNSIGSILENYQELKQLWEECLETKLEPDIKG